MQLFLISGLSGSGKSVALKMLEDSGFYCVDNLPADLLAALVAHLQHAGYSNIAVSIDVRSANSVQRLPPLLQQIRHSGVDVHVLFLDAQNDTLVKRFSETRRLHPLSDATLPANDRTARTLPECVSTLGSPEYVENSHHLIVWELPRQLRPYLGTHPGEGKNGDSLITTNFRPSDCSAFNTSSAELLPSSRFTFFRPDRKYNSGQSLPANIKPLGECRCRK